MARRSMPEGEALRREALAEARAFVGPERKPRKRNGAWDQATTRAELEEMVKGGDWRDARPKHFVELFMRMHLKVYGVEALELRVAKARGLASFAAAKALRDHFADDPVEMAEFMRWTWRDQERQERRRRDGTNSNEFRVTWRYQWSPGLVTNYRRSMMIRGANVRA